MNSSKSLHIMQHILRYTLSIAMISCFMLILSPGRALGDVTARIQGTVTDPTGAVIPGVKITVTNVATGVSRHITSAADGSFVALSLHAPGVYDVTAVKSGFKKFTAQQISLSVTQIYVLHIKMELGSVTQEVTVQAAPVQVQTTSMQMGATITGSAIVNLPLNGRDWVQLQRTLPGVVASIDFADNFSTDGGRSQDNGFMINGNDANDLPLNTPLVIPSPDAIAQVRMITSTINPEYGRNSGAILNAVTKSGTNAFHGDAFEFYRDPFLNARNFFLPRAQFHQNMYGGTLGGPIWKNHTFFFFSYEGLKNRAPIAPGRGYAGGTTTVLTQDQRNGLFPDLATSTGVSAVPLVGENGTTYPAGTAYSTLFPTGTIPNADLNPVAMGLVNKYMPLPNFGPTEFSWNPLSVNSWNQYITRIDQHFGTKDSMFAYWFIQPRTTSEDESFYGGSLPGFGEHDTAKVNNMNLNWTHIFSGNMLNEARVGYNRFNYVTVFPNTPVQPSSVGFTGITPQLASGAGVPCIDIAGYEAPTGQCAFGFSIDGPQPRIDQTFQTTDNFSWVKGKHTMKFGFDMRRSAVENPFGYINNGYYAFYGDNANSTGNPAADFLLGLPDVYEQTSGGFIDAREQAYYSYAQDEWKARNNLTITYGMGWQVNTPYNDIYNGGVAVNAFRPGQQSTVYPTAPAGLLFPGDKGITTSTYHTHYNDFTPRLGFAWSPGSSGKTSIRAGFGVYYNQVEEELTLQNLGAYPFSLTSYGASYNPAGSGIVSLANPFTDITGAAVVPNGFPYTPPRPGDTNVDFSQFYPMELNVMNPNFQTPVAYNYNLNIERELPSQTILTVAYVGHLGRHLETAYELNPAGQYPGINPVCAAISDCNAYSLPYDAPQTFRYDPNIFGSIGQQATDANSNYNSLQITLNKHTTHGLSFFATYTWSHSLDTTSSFENVGGFGAPNPFNLNSNYGDSSYDARQVFVVSYNYQVPSIRRFSAFGMIPSAITDGWQLSGLTTFQSGFPIGLFDSSYNSLICNAGLSFYGCPDRPNVVGPVVITNPRTGTFVNTTQDPKNTTAQGNYYFNPNSFAPETAGVLGDAGRNFFHGPGINNTDLGIYKDTKITEKTTLQLRFEFFNIFNHTQFNNPVSDINSVSFGRVLSARDPRIIQLAAKLYF